MSIPALLLLLGLGEARLVRLVTEDKITEPLRMWAIKRWGEREAIPYLVHCRWCSGIWISAALCGFAWMSSLCTLPVALLLVPAVAYAGQIIASTIEG